MRKLIAAAFLIFTAFNSFAQMSKMNFSLVKKITAETNPQRPVAIFAKGNINTIKNLTANLGGEFKYAAGDVASIILPISQVMTLAADPSIEAVEDGYLKLQVLCDSLVKRNDVVRVHNGAAPLPQGYDGTGVVMGFLDTGIDYSHPDFKDAAGNTRVKYIWDHTLTGGTAPQPYNYGREFTEADINGGLAGPHLAVAGGHGTHVTGVGVSNGLATGKYAGTCPKADIIAVSLDFNLDDDAWLSSVADAVNYIFSKANLMGKPCVINISAGSYYGSHDAKDLQAQMIDNLITQQNGRSVVVAAGNAGSIPFHMQYNNSLSTDTMFTWFSTNPNPIYMEMWADQANFGNIRFTVGADKTSPNYEFRGQMAFSGVSSHVGVFKTDTVYSLNGNRLALVQSFASLSNGRYSMIFNVIADSVLNYNYRLSYKGTGKFDLWSFQMLNSGLPNAATYPPIAKYNFPDLNQTIVSSFSCSDKVITVAEYINKNAYLDCRANPQSLPILMDSLSPNSSHGPTRTGFLKPDIAGAGGIAMAPVVLALIDSNNTNISDDCMHVRDGGTSTASPGVAGIAALYLQRYPTANWLAVKNAITLCNRRDNYTGLTGFPKYDWGYGKVDGFFALTGCSALAVNEINPDEVYFSISPNPVTEQTTVHYDLSKRKIDVNAALKITDVLGNEVRAIALNSKNNSVVISKNSLRTGIYFITLTIADKKVKTEKLVVL